MAYTPTNWQDGVTPVNAVNLNKLEQGLAAAVGIPADVVVSPASALLIRNRFGAGDANPAYRLSADGKQEWGPGGATNVDTSLYRDGAGILGVDGGFWVNGGMMGTTGTLWLENNIDPLRLAIGVYSGVEANDRWEMDGNGKMRWGPGGATPVDTTLYRSSAGVLTTDGPFVAAQFVSHPTGGQVGWHSNPVSGANYMIYHQVQSEAYPRFTMDGGGSLNWGGGAANTDIGLQRVGAGSLFTQANFTMGTVIPSDMYLGSGKFFIRNDGFQEWGPGDWSRDTNLYRSSAGVLKTDGGLTVMGQITMGSTLSFGASSYIYNGAQPVGYATLISRAAGDADNRFTLSNTGHMYYGDGTNPPDVQLRRYTAGYLGIEGGLRITTNLAFDAGAVGSAIIAATTPGDTGYRFNILTSGQLNWGAGVGGTDTNLYRSSVAQLKTDGGLWIDGAGAAHALYFGAGADVYLYRNAGAHLQTNTALSIGKYLDIRTEEGLVGGAVGIYMSALSNDGSGYILVAKRASDTNWRYMMNGAGYIQWGPGGAANPDTNLYRSGVGILNTGGEFRASGPVRGSEGASQIIIGDVFANTNPTVAFGTSGDAIYRDSAGNLAIQGMRLDVTAEGIRFSDGSVQTVAGGGYAVKIHRVYRNAATSVGDNRVSFEGATTNDEGAWASGNPEVVMVGTGGLHRVTVQAWFTGGTGDGNQYLTIQRIAPGNVLVEETEVSRLLSSGSGWNHWQTGVCTFVASAGDAFAMRCRGDATGSAGNFTYAVMTVERIHA